MIGKKIKKRLAEKGFQQTQLSKHLGISPSRLSNYLSGKREIPFELLCITAKYLDVDMNYFSDIPLTSSPAGLSGSATAVDGVVAVPYVAFNSPKRVFNAYKKSIPEWILDGADSDKAVLFHVNIPLNNDYIKENDILVTILHESGNLPHNSYAVIPGRNARLVKCLLLDGVNYILGERGDYSRLDAVDSSETLYIVKKVFKEM